MSRIRSIHPGMFTDEDFVGLSCDAQIFLIGLWCEADDQGVFEMKPVTLRTRLRPCKDGPVEPLLDELKAANWWKPFSVKGKQYGALRNFRKWQRPKTPNAIHPLPRELVDYVQLNYKASPGRKPSAKGGSEPEHDEDGVISEIDTPDALTFTEKAAPEVYQFPKSDDLSPEAIPKSPPAQTIAILPRAEMDAVQRDAIPQNGETVGQREEGGGSSNTLREANSSGEDTPSHAGAGGRRRGVR